MVTGAETWMDQYAPETKMQSKEQLLLTRKVTVYVKVVRKLKAVIQDKRS